MPVTLGIDNKLKEETKSNLEKMGLDMTTATKMYFIYKSTRKITFYSKCW